MSAPRLTAAQRNCLEAAAKRPYVYGGDFGPATLASLVRLQFLFCDGMRHWQITDAGRAALKGGGK